MLEKLWIDLQDPVELCRKNSFGFVLLLLNLLTSGLCFFKAN